MNGNGRLPEWAKVALSLFIPFLLGAMAFATVRTDVKNLKEVSDKHATAEVVSMQYRFIIGELAEIRQMLQSHEERATPSNP